MKFRKKPVEIEAVQWTGSNTNEIVLFAGEACRVLSTDPETGKPISLVIHTLEGDMSVNVNDWIIKGVNGEFYPCKPDIFEKTYEKVEECSAKPELPNGCLAEAFARENGDGILPPETIWCGACKNTGCTLHGQDRFVRCKCFHGEGRHAN